mmetsp:Transcript_8867/g.21597  ORF Transcript_8867/g.21597 Transcript_8867/m.21597 type:complete len:356 (+) Transcript_8867:403-1470(+)
MPGPKSKRITPRNFIPQGRLKSLVWHSRTQDPSIEDPHVAAPSTRAWSIDNYHACDRDRSKNVEIREPLPVTFRGGADTNEVRAHHPFNFDPCQLNKDVTHTAPYMTTITKRRLRPTDGNPEVRDMTDCRPHRQGSLHDILGNTAPVWTSIPGYTGHIRGKAAENVYGLGYSTANEYAEVAQDKRRRPTENGFRQSTASFTIRCPQGTWQDQAYKHWTPATHGMTHQEGPPYGNGTEFRQRLRVGEQMKLNESEERHANATHEVTTWAANKPSETRGHNGWRRGIKGYGGWKPKWKEDKDLFYQPQLGKVYPPYYPEVTRYSTILQPDETPRDLNIIQAVRSARSSASSASARNK